MTSTRQPAKKAAKKTATKPGLYANIHAKQERIAHGSGETMREPGSPGAPSDEAFAKAEQGQPAKKTAARKPAKKPAAGKAAKKPAARKRSTAKK
ncbi:MAG TPA: hypothetical protein VHM00_06665 [Caldimonas sp.]|jgi:hypothetical protein|nr:hypothetical protein [Caldimonas sp.]HEX2540749.1 hypothetical protein [Caldimonas sp.]